MSICVDFLVKFNSSFTKNNARRFATKSITLSLLTLCITIWVPKQLKAQKLPAKTTTLIYIDQYKDIAVAEMKRTGIPASITLAQGIIESNSGESNLAANFNNHFGIKCKSDWKGETTYQDDDTKQECFRVYPSSIYSYIDHSNFIKTRPNYAPLFELDPVDDSAWAYGLKKAGYATASDYPKKLLKVIDDYELSQYNFPELANEKDSAETEAPTTHFIQYDTTKPSLNKISGIETVSPSHTSAPMPVNSLTTITLNTKDTSLKTNSSTKPSSSSTTISSTTSSSTSDASSQLASSSSSISESKVKEKTEVTSPVNSNAPIAANSLTTPLNTKKEESNNNNSYPNKPFKINQVPVLWATRGSSFLQIAKEHNISLYKIFKYNDLPESDLVNQSQLIFLAAKKKEGATTFHVVQKDETWYSISQTEGIQLSFLRSYNSKINEDKLKIGTQLLLIEPKESKNKIVLNKK
jgi:flagellum-specific peptidoglycan hydrolase FlgJ